MGHSCRHFADGRQACRMHEFGFHVGLLGDILDDVRNGGQALILVHDRIIGDIEYLAGIGFQALIDGPRVGFQRRHGAFFTGRAATVKPRITLVGVVLPALQVLAGSKHFGNAAAVVKEDVVVRIQQQNGVGDRLEGGLPALLGAGDLFVEP